MTLLDVLVRAGVPYRRSGDEVAICCPFCPANRGEVDTGFCFHLNVRNGRGHCWHSECDYRTRKAIPAVLRALGHHQEVSRFLPEEEVVEEQVALPEDFLPLTKASDDRDALAVNYVRRRGITWEQIRKYRIGVSYVGKYAYRVIVPVYVGKKLQGLVARDFTGRQTPKYLNSRGDKYLFGFDPRVREVVLLEGVFKAMRMAQAGRSSAALLGHDLTDIQLEQIRESKCRHIIFYPDPDPVGRRGVTHMAEKLLESWSGKISVMWPVTLPADEAPSSVLRATPVIPYNWLTAHRLGI